MLGVLTRMANIALVILFFEKNLEMLIQMLCCYGYAVNKHVKLHTKQKRSAPGFLQQCNACIMV